MSCKIFEVVKCFFLFVIWVALKLSKKGADSSSEPSWAGGERERDGDGDGDRDRDRDGDGDGEGSRLRDCCSSGSTGGVGDCDLRLCVGFEEVEIEEEVEKDSSRAALADASVVKMVPTGLVILYCFRPGIFSVNKIIPRSCSHLSP